MCGRGALEELVKQETIEAYGGPRKRLRDAGVPEEWTDLAAVVGAEDAVMEGPRARYNIAPTDWIPTLVDSGAWTLMDTRWGIPRGAKGGPAFNVRWETLRDGTAWTGLLERGRAIHVLSGFYEWRGGNTQDPVYVHRPDGMPLFLAALMDERPDRTFSATVTVEAPDWFAPVHDRFPRMLSAHDAGEWLAHGTLPPAGNLEHELELRPVQTLVNKVGNDGPQLIRRRPTLF